MSAPTRARMAAFVFRYIMEQSAHGSMSASVSGTTTYDECLDFVCAFGEAFPGRKSDPNHVLSSKRLRTLLKRLSDDGFLERWRLGNQDQYHPRQEPNWQYAYALSPDLYQGLKAGKLTLEELADRWCRR